MLAKNIQIANVRCAALACEEMNIPYKVIDSIGNAIEVSIANERYYFVYSRNPMTTITESAICTHKGYADALFKDELPLPHTQTFFDPKSEHYVLENDIKNYDDVLRLVLETFETLPVIVKMSTGLQGRNVFLCKNRREIKRAIRIIFNQKKRNYATSLVVQEYIDIQKEFRVIVMNGEVKLVYEKISDNKKTNLSPLHNSGSKTVIILDKDFLAKMQEIVDQSPTFKAGFSWNGLDVAQQPDGSFIILELNAHPGFTFVARDNGDRVIIDIYKEVLEFLKNKKS